MNERQLRYLDMIAKKGSIQKASSFLAKNPSTLTRMVKNAENELGVTLFLRTPAGLIPTPEGERVLFYARGLLDRFRQLEAWGGYDGKTADKALHDWTENEIRYLLVIREQKNISRAAAELYLAQPSLSQMILDLESDLGQKIFDRIKEGVRETGFGRELLDQLEVIYDGYRRMRTEIEEFQQMKRGTITIGIPMNLGTYLLPLFLPSFCEKYPGIQVRIRENNTSELERLLLARKIDFCIMHDNEHQDAVVYETFSDDPFFLVMPGTMRDKFAFVKDQVLTVEDLQEIKNLPFIMVANRQKLRLVADDILRHAGIIPHIRCTTRSMETAKRLVAAGMGVTFLPYSYLTLYSGSEGLECFPLDAGLNGSWKLTAAYLKKASLSPGARECLRLLKECLR